MEARNSSTCFKDRALWRVSRGQIDGTMEYNSKPLVGCRANEIENLLTAEPRVASEKEKNRYLKFITATKRRTLKKREKKQIYKEVRIR